MKTYQEWMQEALDLVDPKGLEIPVGALVLRQDKIIGKGVNHRQATGDIFGHAEIAAIQEAAKVVGTWNLEGCSLIVTLEPCLMCAGAIIASRLDMVVFGAYNPKAGAFGSLLDVTQIPNLNHYPRVYGGILERSCSKVLSAYFQNKR